MKPQLTWKCSLFGNTTDIYAHGSPVGKLSISSFKQIAHGELNGKRYTFKTKGWWQPNTVIFDAITGNIVGNITYNGWHTGAKISDGNKLTTFRYDNAWNTRWSLFESSGIQYYFTGSTSKGSVMSDDINEFSILSALFIANYFQQTNIALMIAVFVPLFVVIL